MDRVGCWKPGNTYTWSTGATTRTILAGSTGEYMVTVDNGYCTTSDEVRAIFNPIPDRMPTHQYFTCLDEDRISWMSMQVIRAAHSCGMMDRLHR